MGDNGSQNQQKNRSLGASGQAAYALVKASAAEKKAQANVATANKRLSVAIYDLQQSKAGGSKERKARKAVRKAVNGLVRAKRNLKRAQKKREKAAAKQAPKERAKGTARVAARPSAAAAGRRSSYAARTSAPKPRKARTKPGAVSEPRMAEDRAATNTTERDNVQGTSTPQELATDPLADA